MININMTEEEFISSLNGISIEAVSPFLNKGYPYDYNDFLINHFNKLLKASNLDSKYKVDQSILPSGRKEIIIKIKEV